MRKLTMKSKLRPFTLVSFTLVFLVAMSLLVIAQEGGSTTPSPPPRQREGFRTDDNTYILFDGTHWQNYDDRGRLLPIITNSDFDNQMNNFWNNPNNQPSGWISVPIVTFQYYDTFTTSTPIYAPLNPTDNFEYRIVESHLEVRQSGSNGRWLNLEDPNDCSPPGCDKERAYNNFRQSYPNVLGASSATATAPTTPATPAPPSPEVLSALARAAAAEEARKAREDVAQGKITHREAYQRIQQLANARVNDATLENINTAPVGSQVLVNGVRYRKQSDNSWRTSSGTTATDSDLSTHGATELIKADDLELVRQLRQQANTFVWQGSWMEALGGKTYAALAQGKWVGGEIAGSVLTFVGKLGTYQALSNALFGAEASRNWLINADNELLNKWADLPAFASRQWCDYDDARRSKSPGQSTTFIHTVGGSYQFVGSIQAEKSSQKSPIVCELNTNPEVDQEWVCSKRQVCGSDNFCYLDANGDGTPDTPDPVQGYFYKITWGVTAPTDEKFTPYIDENGKAIKFNLQLMGEKSVWMYQRPGTDMRAAIALNNGQNDQDVIVHYSPDKFTEVCIRYDDRSRAKDSDGNTVGDQCVSFIENERGKTEYAQSDRRTPSVTSSSPEISRSSDW